MNTPIPFTKMHGLGNDFVIIKDSMLRGIKDMRSFVIKISDRKIGIGCDQFISYKKQDDQVTMSIYNPDGTRAKACGNASRCLTRIMFDEHKLKNIHITIGDKKITGQYIDPKNITVNMGEASFNESWMPNPEDLWQLAEKFRIEPKEVLCVDVGNPHLVIFTKISDKDKKIIGKSLQIHELFPEGINVNFAEIGENVIDLKVWERGTGFTYACGSGASATFAAASKLGFVDDTANVAFKLGLLKMSKKNTEILMNGSASYVFTGEYQNE